MRKPPVLCAVWLRQRGIVGSCCLQGWGGGGVELAGRRGVDGLLGRAVADGVPHCEGRRLASRGGIGGRGGDDGRRWWW